jgi:LuxR family maltose regulon positive regulatory protein
MQILVLLALAHDARGDRPTALDHLGRAVTLAEPEGHVRLFLDEGPRLRALLEPVARHGASAAYARRLLEGRPDAARHAGKRQPLVDPLSDRELDVLRLLASDLSGPEMARELTVSLNTLRTHTKSIYAKLGVGNRRAAVRRGDELRLLSHRTRR